METPGQYKILIIDDDEMILSKLLQRISDLGYQVQGANNGQTALSYFQSDSYDLVITDLKMPQMGGVAFLEAIALKDESIPVIVMTGFGEIHDVIQLLKLGVHDYLSKPLEWEEMHFAVEKALEKRGMILEKQKWETQLEQQVQERTLELSQTNEKLTKEIKERQLIEEKLVFARNEAESANQAKSNFLANMSHEIRTPLHAIIGFSEILLARVKSLNLPREYVGFIENIKISGENLSELINSILDLSKIEAGKMENYCEDFNVKQLIQTVSDILKAHVILKNIDYSCDIDSLLPEMIHSDPAKLNQILTNLLKNAIKFTPSHKSISLSVLQKDKFLVFKVSDQGIGIPHEKLDSIFNAFEQVDGSKSRQYEGTGLGLTIAKQMAESLGGRLEVESVVDQGTTMTVSIPLVLGKTREDTSPQLQEFQFAKDNVVLLVEDNRMNQLVARSLFQELGIDLQIVDEGIKGVEQILEQKPDLVLMDIHMPGLDGLQITELLRKNYPECQKIPIVALSADAFPEQRQKALEAGCSDYLTKPLDLYKLKSVLAQYLRQEVEIET